MNTLLKGIGSSYSIGRAEFCNAVYNFLNMTADLQLQFLLTIHKDDSHKSPF